LRGPKKRPNKKNLEKINKKLVLKRLGGNSGIEELVLAGSGPQQLPNALVRIGTTDPANNAKMAAIAGICELIKFIGIQARETFDSCENGSDPFLQHNMDKGEFLKILNLAFFLIFNQRKAHSHL